ncbi:MAG: hypothetical protein P8Z68_05095 [Kineosporiaceae bacterium]|jgi:quinol monooxygenase YgiN
MPGPTSTVHIVIFRLRPDADPGAFLHVTDQMLQWLRKQPGFVDYELYRGEPGQDWADRLVWRTPGDAERARERFATTQVFAELTKYVEDDYRSVVAHPVPLAS